MTTERLNVIALISGGKDSFFSLLHCIHHGHRVVALANLFPAQGDDDEGSGGGGGGSDDAELQVIDPGLAPTSEEAAAAAEADGMAPATDLNSFMYQTVGHEVIPLYAAATGLPLYRLPIRGGAVRHERDYDFSSISAAGGRGGGARDETEAMTSLLGAIRQRHPEANAVSAGAILSTYQRTRVESVALRLGLAPLAFLWKYPVLPRQPDEPAAAATAPWSGESDDAQLLRDMGDAGLDARIIKVASAGLGDDFLWTPVTSPEGIERIQRALRRFGTSHGAVLGEGGEFETLVVDGPRRLFRRRIDFSSASKTVVREGGGTSWLMLKGAEVADKASEESEAVSDSGVRTPDLLEARFQAILSDLSPEQQVEEKEELAASPSSSTKLLGKSPSWPGIGPSLSHWVVVGDEISSDDSIEAETASLVSQVRHLLVEGSLEPDHILNTVIILRRMSDFPKINPVYGKLFSKPNPPSRVTISCGDLLPDGRNIAIALTVGSPAMQPAQSRQGLHVQSRSYWAPANIGPYSQAIGAPVLSQGGSTDLRAWSIAGQIPLIPGTMVLPPPSDSSLHMQVVLSLQHLWRIAVDVRIQFWTSAIAFFARAPSAQAMEHNADIAGRAWRLAHRLPDDEDDDDDDDDDDANNGPDLWDLKYNPEYAGLGSAGDVEPGLESLPDWSVLTLRQQNEAETCIPPFFAVEVEELPRGSDVEWHAHLGLSQAHEGSVEVVGSQTDVGSAGWTAWHTIARTGDAALLHTVLALALDTAAGGDAADLNMDAVRLESVRRLGISIDSQEADAPYLVYVDAVNTRHRDGELGRSAMIPCRSMHSPGGRRWAVICLYRTVVQI